MNSGHADSLTRDQGPDGTSGTVQALLPVIDATMAQRIIEKLPEEAFQLIIREAYLFRAGQVIFEGMGKARSRHETVSASRPPFLILRKAGTRETFAASLESANSDLALYERAVKRNADAMMQLQKCAESHIEKWLRENDETYYSGLVSETLVGDWRRCVSRLETRLGEFIKAVGCARNSMVGTLPDRHGVRRLSEVSRTAIKDAARIGGIVAREVMATNGIADARDRHLRNTAFADSFPRLPAFDFAAHLEEATVLPVSFLQEQFGKIMDRCRELREVGLPALLEAVRQAETKHAAIKESYLVNVWKALREFALTHYVDEADLNEVAQATELMLERGQIAVATGS